MLSLAVVVSSFAIYSSNGQQLVSYDTAPNSLLAFNLFEHQRLDFDRFRGGYFTALGGQYAFAEAPNGHLTSVFPIGAALVTLPLYALFFVAAHGLADAPAIDSAGFEPLRQRYEKMAAAAVAALSAGLFLLCAREIANGAQAAIATAVYALATSLWSICSQALWQHGPLNFLLLAMVYALFRANRAREPAARALWLLGAGVCGGLLPVIRPTAALFSAAGLIFAAWTFRRRASAFAAGLAIGIAPGVAWNAYFFHSLLGGYGTYSGVVPGYELSPRRALAALAALLLSPSRGLLIFSPVLIFSAAGFARAWRVGDRDARLAVLLAIASTAVVVQYAFFRGWWGGFAYGPRYLSDIDAVAALLLVYVIPQHPLSRSRGSAAASLPAAAFALLLAYSVGVQFVGTNSGAAGSEWNAVPISIDLRPERVWQIRDSQIERNVRAAYVRFFDWNAAGSPPYRRGLAAHVTSISPSLAHAEAGTSVDATAAVSNDGRSPAYGYPSGVYVGQMRVRVRLIDEREHTAAEQFLYLDGSPAAGEHAAAIGTITLGAKPGDYVLECDPVLVGGGAPAVRGAPFRVAVHVGDGR